MAWYPPPEAAPNSPLVTQLAGGSVLYRVHSARFDPLAFNPTDPDSLEAGGGGRFDSPGGRPAFLYAARAYPTAIAEALLRDVPFDDKGMRQLPRAALDARCLSELTVTAELPLIALHGEGLSRLGQDTWLVDCGADEYPRTRAWGSGILGWFPNVPGLEWRPRHDDDGLAVCLYEDRLTGSLEVVRVLDLWRDEGLSRAAEALRRFGVAARSR